LASEAAVATLDLDALTQLEFPIVEYEVSREKIREYVTAVGDRNPLHSDPAAAHRLGYRDIVAPPTFAAVFSTLPMRRALADAGWVTRSTIDPSRILHGGQSFEFARSVVPGDRLIVQSIVDEVYEKKGLVFLVLATRVHGDGGERVLDAKTTLIIRL
jgi:acyl dehydratase